jgi:hypothetical protein
MSTVIDMETAGTFEVISDNETWINKLEMINLNVFLDSPYRIKHLK